MRLIWVFMGILLWVDMALGYSGIGAVQIHKLQLRGSHNSYHQQPLLPLYKEWRYSHPTLASQVGSLGIRQLELDLYWNPIADRFDVYHIPIVDARTSCATFSKCLRELYEWSVVANDHPPIFIFLEPKMAKASRTAQEFASHLDRAIQNEVPRSAIFTPDDFQGGFASIRDARKFRAWPYLDEVRGKFVFVLLGSGGALRKYYTYGEQNLEDRLAFVLGRKEETFAAFASPDNPFDPRVLEFLQAGFMVRIRADAGLNFNPERRLQALGSRAQIISTDFVRPDHPHYFTLEGEDSRDRVRRLP